MKPLRALALLWLIGLHGLAQAACDTGLAERLHAKLHPRDTLDHALAVCEPWPGVRDRIIVVLPLPHDTSASGNGPRHFDLDVLVVQRPDNGNSERDTVASRLLDADALVQENGERIEIHVDPTRYRLGHDARAFGLRILRGNDKPEAPASSESLSLYLPRGARLDKLLDDLELSAERGTRGGECEGEFRTRRTQVSVEDAGNKGLARLVLRRNETVSRSRLQDDECLTQRGQPRYQQITLHFDGQRYRLPPAEGKGQR